MKYIFGRLFASLIRKISELDICLQRIESDLESTRIAIVQNRVRAIMAISKE